MWTVCKSPTACICLTSWAGFNFSGIWLSSLTRNNVRSKRSDFVYIKRNALKISRQKCQKVGEVDFALKVSEIKFKTEWSSTVCADWLYTNQYQDQSQKIGWLLSLFSHQPLFCDENFWIMMWFCSALHHSIPGTVQLWRRNLEFKGFAFGNLSRSAAFESQSVQPPGLHQLLWPVHFNAQARKDDLARLCVASPLGLLFFISFHDFLLDLSCSVDQSLFVVRTTIALIEIMSGQNDSHWPVCCFSCTNVWRENKVWEKDSCNEILNFTF